jgi:hypothetical protein
VPAPCAQWISRARRCESHRGPPLHRALAITTMMSLRRHIHTLVTVGLIASIGTVAFAQPNKKGTARVTATVIKQIEIAGVDAEAGNPEIRVMSTGALNLLYQVFPPMHVKTDEQGKPYETFDKQLEKYIGVPVSWEDRELFHIAKPRADTIERTKAFVQAFPKAPGK